MKVLGNGDYIKLLKYKGEQGSGYDLEVKVSNDDNVLIKTNIVKGNTRYDIALTVEDIEALYHFAQVLKLNK